MLNFSTEIPIDPKNSVADVIRVACEWITASPHTKIPKNALAEYREDMENNFDFGHEKATIVSTKVPEVEMGGLRYSRVEKSGLQWTTTMVTTRTNTQHVIGFQVTCEALTTAARLPFPRKPRFLEQTVARLGGGSDGEIPVADKPFILSNGDEAIAAALIRGTANNSLPIVYVSSDSNGRYLLDPNDLAQSVAGMAHVVVEPGPLFSSRLKLLVSSRNVYGGTVGVYWPQTVARRSYFLNEDTPTVKDVEAKIATDIMQALSNRRPRTTSTWPHLMELVSRRRLEKLRAEGSKELNDYVVAFDAENAAKDIRILEAESEIARLNAEVRRLAARSIGPGEGMLSRGEEIDFYENEIRDFVIDALRDALRNAKEGSRRSHVIADLLSVNQHSGASASKREEIKQLFNSYKEMDTRIRGALSRLGFEISEDGKHYKAVFCSDARYTFSISKTGSDHRGGKNMASDINSALF